MAVCEICEKAAWQNGFHRLLAGGALDQIRFDHIDQPSARKPGLAPRAWVSRYRRGYRTTNTEKYFEPMRSSHDNFHDNQLSCGRFDRRY